MLVFEVEALWRWGLKGRGRLVGLLVVGGG